MASSFWSRFWQRQGQGAQTIRGVIDTLNPPHDVKLTTLPRLYHSLATVPTAPEAAGATEADVLAADLRMRKRLTAQTGRRSTQITGGLGDSPARLAMPSLVGV